MVGGQSARAVFFLLALFCRAVAASDCAEWNNELLASSRLSTDFFCLFLCLFITYASETCNFDGTLKLKAYN